MNEFKDVAYIIEYSEKLNIWVAKYRFSNGKIHTQYGYGVTPQLALINLDVYADKMNNTD